MDTFVIVLIVIIAVLLGGLVLIQNPKGGGLAVGFQGSTQIGGGVQNTNKTLEKATWYLAIALFVLCLVSASFYTTSAPPAPEAEQTEAPAENQGAEQQNP